MAYIKSLKIKRKQWELILRDIKENNPPSTFLIRSNMKKHFGFVPRFPAERDEDICLDFFSEKKKTMFILKYGEQLNA